MSDNVKMTKEMAAQFERQTHQWTEFILSTEKSDKPRAERAVRQMYKKLGIPEPQIIWTKSPFGNSICRSILNSVAGTNLSGKNLGPDLNKYQHNQYIWKWSGSELEEIWTSSFIYNLTKALDLHILNIAQRHAARDMPISATPLREPMKHARSVAYKYITECNLLDFRKNSSFEESLLTEARFWKKHWHKNRICSDFKYVYPRDWLGQHYASSLVLYSFMGEIGYSDGYQCLEEISELSKFTGCIIPCENICFMSERHTVLKVDDMGLLHCEDGPALTYSDGYEAYRWHGTSYPAEWIQNPPSLSEALQWPNLEQRRIACEIIGWDRILDELNAVVINCDDDPAIGELVSVELPGIGTELFLRVRCGTGRDFVLPVPPTMKTAHRANAWTWGLWPSQYQPEVRT